MIIKDNASAEEDDRLVDETIAMGVSGLARKYVLKSLTELYSVAETAMMRELTANALDSHVLAGSIQPVEVTLPTDDEPFFIVRDYGISMSRAEVRSFGQYGDSTKRETNDQVGGFGLGGKSPLALVSSFDIEAVKDGEKVFATCRWGDDGPEMDLHETIETEKRNGVTITVPTRPSSRYGEAVAQHMFLGWKPNSITVNGKNPPASIYDTRLFEEVGTTGWLIRPGFKGIASDDDAFRVLLGPIKYDVRWAEIPSLSRHYPYEARKEFLSRAILDLPIGSVELTPSREAIKYTQETLELLKAKLDEMMLHGASSFHKRINSAATIRDALMVRQEAATAGFPTVQFTYKGAPIDFTQPSVPDKSALVSRANNAGGYIRISGRGESFWQGENLVRELLRSPRMLIVDAGEPNKRLSRRASQVHAIASKTRQYRDARRALGQPVYDLDFIQYSAREINPFILGAYNEVATAVEVEETIKTYSAQRRAERKAELIAAGFPSGRRPRGAIASVPVRILRVGLHGRSGYEEGKLSELDTSKTYVLIKDGVEPLQRLLKAGLFTKTHYYENTQLIDVFYRMVSSTLVEDSPLKDHVFLVATATMKTDKYADVLKMRPIKDVLSEYLRSSVVVPELTDIEALAKVDSVNSDYRWARSLGETQIEQIERKETRNWILAMKAAEKTGTAAIDAQIETAQRIASKFSLDIATRSTVAATAADMAAKLESPGKRYPLLFDNYLHTDARKDAAVVYVNLIDKSLAEA